MAWRSWNAQNAQQEANCSLGRMEPRPDPMASETQNCTFQCFLCWQWHVVLASAFYVVLLDWHLIARHCMHNPPVVSGVKLWWKEGLINVSATGWGITWWLGSPVATRFSTQGRLVCGWSEVAWHCDLPWGTCRDDSLFTSAFFDSSAPRFVVLMIWSKSCTFEYPHTATRHTPATCFGRKGDTWVLSATTCYHYRSLNMSLFAVALSLQPSSRPRDVDWAPRGHFVTPHIHFGAQLLTIPYNTIQYHTIPQRSTKYISMHSARMWMCTTSGRVFKCLVFLWGSHCCCYEGRSTQCLCKIWWWWTPVQMKTWNLHIRWLHFWQT